MRAVIAVLALIAFLCAPSPALAGEGADTEADGKAEGCGNPKPSKGLFASIRAGFSAWRPSLEFQAAAGWSFGAVGLGVVFEDSPWMSFSRPGIDAGALHFGLLLQYRRQLTPKAGLRFELMAGGSALLFTTYGYHAGTVGMWLGARVMGLDVRLGKRFALTIDVVDLSLPIFHPDTMPLIYPAWRWSIGLAFY